MKITHYIPCHFPVRAYGGTERVAYWLAKAQAEMGHEVRVICLRGSHLSFAQVIGISDRRMTFKKVLELVPSDTEMLQLYATPPMTPPMPYLVNIGGNAKAREVFLPNTVFVSQDHAKRHGWTEYVHNGLDLSEYPLSTEPRKKRLLFLAKASWWVKNLKGSLQVAEKLKMPLDICGGSAPLLEKMGFRRSAHKYWGMASGQTKTKLLQESSALLFPVIWDEPFGIATIEAMASGTPVVATQRGGLSEIITPQSGVLAESLEELMEGVGTAMGLDAGACRHRVEEAFTHRHMGEKYLKYYKKIIKDGILREGFPQVGPDFVTERYLPYEGLE